MKSILYLATIPIILFGAFPSNAQTTSPNPRLDNSSGQLDRARPIQQPVRILNLNSNSQQFFDRGRDKLYFLEESEPILQIEPENERETEEDRIQKPKETLEQPE